MKYCFAAIFFVFATLTLNLRATHADEHFEKDIDPILRRMLDNNDIEIEDVTKFNELYTGPGKESLINKYIYIPKQNPDFRILDFRNGVLLMPKE